MIDFTKALITVRAEEVEYTHPRGPGVLVVVVRPNARDPQVKSWARTGNGEVIPASLYISEISQYVNDAERRMNR